MLHGVHGARCKTLFSTVSRLNARIQDERDGGREYDFGTDIHKLSYIYLFPPYLIFSYTFLLFPVDAYTFQSLKKRENVIFQNMLFIFPCLFCHLHHLLHLPEPFFYVGLDLGSAKFCSSFIVYKIL